MVNGFNVTKLLQKDVNISLTIELYLADEFALNTNLTISITDAQLWVAYVLIETPEPPPQSAWPYLYGLMGAGVLMIGGFAAYEGFFKYPTEVRHIRSLKRKIRRGKTTHPMTSKDAGTLGKEIHAKEQTQLHKKMNSSSTKSPSKGKEGSSKSYVEAEKIKEPKPQETKIKETPKSELEVKPKEVKE
jgi:hypothetical protein